MVMLRPVLDDCENWKKKTKTKKKRKTRTRKNKLQNEINTHLNKQAAVLIRLHVGNIKRKTSLLFVSTLTGKWHHVNDHGKVTVTSKTLQSTGLIVTSLVCNFKHWLGACPKSKTWWIINIYAVPNIRRQRSIDHSCHFCSNPHAFKKTRAVWWPTCGTGQECTLFFLCWVRCYSLMGTVQQHCSLAPNCIFKCQGLPFYLRSSALASQSECSRL